MFAKITGTLVAAAITFTTVGATPAQADQDDVASVAAALLGIAIIGKIISDNKDDDHVTQYRPAPVYRPHTYRPRVQTPRYRPIKPRYARPPVVHPKPLPPRLRHNAKLLPKHCFRGYQTRRGTTYLFGSHCLNKSYRHAGSLPRGCAVSVRSRGHLVRGYDARCLRGRGYALARG